MNLSTEKFERRGTYNGRSAGSFNTPSLRLTTSAEPDKTWAQRIDTPPYWGYRSVPAYVTYIG